MIHMAHEVPDQDRLFNEIFAALRPGGRLLLMEPEWHVTKDEFELSLAAANAAGLRRIESADVQGNRKALFERVEGP